MDPIHELTATDLRTLAEAIRLGRLKDPFSGIAVRRYCPNGDVDALAAILQQLTEEGAAPAAIATMLTLIARAKAPGHAPGDIVDLVWTGPEAPGTPSRDTGAVVRELFMAAKDHILVAGYAVYQGKHVFRTLAEQMDARPELKVEMFLDIQRGHGDTTIAEDLIRRFLHRFKTQEWPGKRMPDIYYDPRALELDRAKKAALHAKCIVVDRAVAFVSSANFTEAAQQRNIEAGALIKAPAFAARLAQHFKALAAAGVLRRIAE